MNDQHRNTKSVVVHIGPHKTGTTAIQQCLSANRDALAQVGIHFMHDAATHNAAMLLVREEFEAAEDQLRSISAIISDCPVDTVILSQEDFCGDLPGRSRRKSIYPKLTRNLRVIARALHPHKVTFVFFVRDEGSWLTSCYHQHLKHRTMFSTIDGFRQHFEETLSWSLKLEKAREAFAERLITLPYGKAPDAGVQAVLAVAGRPTLTLIRPSVESNSSPAPERIRLLERVNSLSEFTATAWFAKSLILKEWRPRPSETAFDPDAGASTELASIALPLLTQRAKARMSRQGIDDILPAENVDLAVYIFDILPSDAALPPASRINIRDQSLILDYHFRGKSRLAKLNALVISYLRRDTDYTNKARRLFHRIWQEQGVLLINELSTRWLISTLQTFLDFGLNERQRLIGSCGYFYANMMKIYEGERAIEGLEQNATYENSAPQTANKFRGLDRYNVGGTDLLLNTNALALDLATRDDVAGLVLMELLLRVKSSANVFTRMDETRQKEGISVEGFADTWSFFEPR